jgi:class II lanthipeptide synthase
MSSDGTFLEAAAAIGRRIVADAVWHDRRCSWVGAIPDDTRPWRAEYRALDPDVYGGTAGVGLLLAQLHATTGEGAFGRTAVGALRHAVARAEHLPLDRRDGFHGGAPGVAWAAVHVADLVDDEELRAGARAVIDAASPPDASDRSPDLVTGAAGSIIALLDLAGRLDEPRLAERAIALGDELLAGATLTRHGWSWALPTAPRRPRLCGLAHGAAGVAWALLDVFEATEQDCYREGAVGAFAYERSWRAGGTWPDLRTPGRRRGAPRLAASPASGTWCHGEAGIALSRLHALSVLGPGPHAEDAELALATTRRKLAAVLPGAIEDLSLCHGVAGAAEALLCGAAALAGRWDDAAGLVRDLGDAAVARHADAGDWPCGVRDATTPGLFVGLSGIAWFLLRLHDPDAPSPLALPGRTLTPVQAGP